MNLYDNDNLTDEIDEIDFDAVDIELEKEDEIGNQLALKEDYSLDDIKRISTRRKLKWFAILFSIIAVLILFITLMLYIIRTNIVKPIAIKKIHEYIKTANNSELKLLDNKIVYSPSKFKKEITVKDLKELLIANRSDQKDFKFAFFKKDENDNPIYLEKINLEDYLNGVLSDIYLKISFDSKRKSPFSVTPANFKDLKFDLDFSKFVFLYDENNKLIYQNSKTSLLSETEELKAKDNITSMQAFLNILNQSIKNVLDDMGVPTFKYQNLFYEKDRNEKITDSELHDLFLSKNKRNVLYVDNILNNDFDTIIRFHNEASNKIYEIKTKLGEIIPSEILSRIRNKIKTPNNGYYFKDLNGHDFLDDKGNKVFVESDNFYEITHFLTDKTDLLSTYEFNKEVYHPEGKVKKEIIGDKEYKVINIYPKLERKKASILFKTSENEVIDKLKFDTGLIENMPLDLAAAYFNNKYINPDKEYFVGWKILNDGKEITYDDIKNNKFYTLLGDVIATPIIKRKVTLTLNLPHESYKPTKSIDKNYYELTYSVKDEENVYDFFSKIKKEKLDLIDEFNQDNEFLGMYLNNTFTIPLERNLKAKELSQNQVIYFKYQYSYFQINFPDFFKNLNKEILKKANLNIPFDVTLDNKGGFLEYDNILEKFLDYNKNNEISEKLKERYIERKNYVFANSGSVITLDVKDKLKSLISVNVIDGYSKMQLYNTSVIKDFNFFPKIKDAIKYGKDEYIKNFSFPYFTHEGRIYKVSAISGKYNFSNILSENDSFNKLEYRLIKDTFYFPIYLRVELHQKEIRYEVFDHKTDEKIFEKTTLTSYVPKDVLQMGVLAELKNIGYNLINSDHYLPRDEEIAYKLQDDDYVFKYKAQKIENVEDAEYITFRFRTRHNSEAMFTHLNFYYEKDYEWNNTNIKYFKKGTLFKDYDKDSIVKYVAWHLREQSGDYNDFWEFTFKQIKFNNGAQELVEPTEPIFDGMWIDIFVSRMG